MPVQQLPQPSPEAVRMMEGAAVRARAARLLAATDHTQAADSPLTEAQRTEVVAYRQALREVLPEGADPFAVAWPDTPACLK